MTTEERIEAIEERNKRVEQDKAWETSWMRISFLALFTYSTVGIFLWSIGFPKSWLNAVVPMIGYVISTLTLSALKKYWLKRESSWKP